MYPFILLYTDHYRRAFGTDDWHNGPGVRGVSNKEVPEICELGFTHYENMFNLHQLVGRGRFRFIVCRSKFVAELARPYEQWLFSSREKGRSGETVDAGLIPGSR